MPVIRVWFFLTSCGSKLLSLSRGVSINWQDYTEPLAKRYDYHGSMQAGICGFGSNLPDLLRTTSPILCTHMIESGRILPPFPQQNNQDLYGYVTTDTANKLISVNLLFLLFMDFSILGMP